MKKKKTISKEEFLDYLKAEKGKTRHIVEREALSDPFMEEAMDGFSEWNNAPESIHAIEELDKRIRPAESKWRIIGAAAAVIIMLGLTMFWVKNLSKETSELAIKSEDPNGGLTIDSNIKSEELLNNKSVPSDAYIEIDRTKDTKVDLPEPQYNMKPSVPSVTSPSSPIASQELYTASDNAVMDKESGGTFFSRSNTDAVSDSVNLSLFEDGETYKIESVPSADIERESKRDVIALEKKSKAKKSDGVSRKENRAPTPNNTFNYQIKDAATKGETSGNNVDLDDKSTLSQELIAAKKLYEGKEFKKSLDAYAVILTENPTSEEALYYTGLNQRQLGEPKNAVKSFERVTKGSIFYYNSRWNMYELLTSDPVKSKAILTELASEPNEYQAKAQKLLNP